MKIVAVCIVIVIFTVICRVSNVKQLKVLEAVYIGMYKPDLCVQKSHVVSLSLVNTLLC